MLFVLPKTNARTEVGALEHLLCPYRGEITRTSIAGGDLYLSSLAGGLLIPRGARKTAQTPWLEIRPDADGLTFETDPLGTFPLWLYEDDQRLIVTSEVKSLLAVGGIDAGVAASDRFAQAKRPPDFSPFRNVTRVYPGALLRLGSGQTRRSILEYRPTSLFTTPEESKAALTHALTASARSIAGCGDEWGAFLSGGIDSSMATALLNRLRPGVKTFTLGTSLGDEYADAKELADHLGVAHTRVTCGPEEAKAAFERAVFCNETVDGLTAETLAQLGILARAAGVPRVITGYGADLLFGSMLRHELYMQVTGVRDLQALIERTMWSGEFSPFYLWSLGVEVHHLFWDPGVMNCAFRVPSEQSFDGKREKVVLREAAVEMGLFEERHAFRKKQALTDGTQFNRVLSSALGLGDGYAYREKNERSIEQLRRLAP